MTDGASVSWRDFAVNVGMAFAVAAAGCAAAFALWLYDISGPQVVFLGSGNRLSMLVSEGPARLVLATGDDPIAYENALSSVQPLFARRVDLLLVAGSGRSLLVPLAAHRDPHVLATTAISALSMSPEEEEFDEVPAFDQPKRIRLGPNINVTVESILPLGADPEESVPAWRATVERGETRIVVLSDGIAASLFPPRPAASVLAISGDDPLGALDVDSASAFIANADVIGGPELREGLRGQARPPAWSFRVAPNEALRLRLVDGGIEVPPDTARPTDPGEPDGVVSYSTAIARRVRQRELPWIG